MRLRAGIIAVCGLALAAGGPSYTAGLTPGEYALTATGGRVAPAVCVSDLSALLQAAHGPDRCQFFTASQAATGTRVTYECANGSGLADLKTLTPRSALVSASGVRGRSPYKMRVNARRTGACRS